MRKVLTVLSLVAVVPLMVLSGLFHAVSTGCEWVAGLAEYIAPPEWRHNPQLSAPKK